MTPQEWMVRKQNDRVTRRYLKRGGVFVRGPYSKPTLGRQVSHGRRGAFYGATLVPPRRRKS